MSGERAQGQGQLALRVCGSGNRRRASEASSDLRARASRSAASCDHQRAMPLVAPHPRFSTVSAVSRSRVPATAVPPSFPRPLRLRQAKEAESAACEGLGLFKGEDADLQGERKRKRGAKEKYDIRQRWRACFSNIESKKIDHAARVQTRIVGRPLRREHEMEKRTQTNGRPIKQIS